MARAHHTVVVAVLAGAIPALSALTAGCPGYLDDPLPTPRDDAQAAAFAVDRLGVDLYGAPAWLDGDRVLSPYSLSAALTMTHAGARGRTADEMADVLHAPWTDARLHEAHGALTAALRAANPTVEENDDGIPPLQLSIANSGWFQEGREVVPSFLDTLEHAHGATVEWIDFSDGEAARGAINAWVDAETRGLIPELLDEGMVGSWTPFVLVDAIYFKGSWSEPFAESATEPFPFHTLDGGTVETPMMQGRRDRWLRGTRFRAIELPYAGSSLSMLVILPDRGQFAAVERDLSAGGLVSVVEHMESHPVDVRLPRFRVESKAELSDALIELGMVEAFQPGADFSGALADGAPYLDFVVHQAVVIVDEKGTEAAAATAVGARETSERPEPEPKTFHADRPFLFAIVDRERGAVLFLGRVTRPVDPAG